MNRQKQLAATFLSLALISVLTGCPPTGTNGTNASPSPGSSPASSPASTPKPGPVGTVPPTPPSGAPLTPLTVFPSNHLICCWDALAKTEPSYPKLALDALNGQEAALDKLVTLSKKLDLTAGYAHGATLAEILTRIGDQRFAYVLLKQDNQGGLEQDHDLFPEKMRENLRNLIEGGFALNSDASVHMKNMTAFPETAKVLKYVIEAKIGK